MIEILLSIGIVFSQFFIFYLFKKIIPDNSSNEVIIVTFFIGMLVRLFSGLFILFILLKYMQLNVLLFIFSLMMLYILFLYFEIKILLKNR